MLTRSWVKESPVYCIVHGTFIIHYSCGSYRPSARSAVTVIVAVAIDGRRPVTGPRVAVSPSTVPGILTKQSGNNIHINSKLSVER